VPRGKTAKSKREISCLQAKERGTGESTPADISNFHSKTPELFHNKFLLRMSPVCGVFSHSWRNSDSVMGTPTVYRLPCVTQLPFLLKSPGQSNCLHDQVILCSLWLDLGSACLWQPPKHHSINSDNLTQTPTLYLKFTFKFCFPMIQCLYIYTLYISKSTLWI
jgi:hypothetical protein